MTAPIITFATPRSGSTLLLRLLNRSTNTLTGAQVRYNGELDVLSSWTNIVNQLLAVDQNGEMSVNALNEDTSFLSHYHYEKVDTMIKHMAEFHRLWCGGVDDWGWKLVNYGVFDYNSFSDNANALIKMYPGAQFITLTRSYNDTLASIKSTDWWDEGFSNEDLERRLFNQHANYKKLRQAFGGGRCHQLTYTDILDYDRFSAFLLKLGWCIAQADYDKVLSNKVRC